MDLRDLVLALLRCDALTARQWVADAARGGFDWTNVPEPTGLDAVGLAVAAGTAELMAGRLGQAPPGWAAAVPAAPEHHFLVQAAEFLPRLRRMCEEEGPEPLRRRRLLAPPGFLTTA